MTKLVGEKVENPTTEFEKNQIFQRLTDLLICD